MGTAAVVSKIDTIGNLGTNYSIPTPTDGKAMEIKRLLNDISLGRTPDIHKWMMDAVIPATAE